jgi:hypothetical protein
MDHQRGPIKKSARPDRAVDRPVKCGLSHYRCFKRPRRLTRRERNLLTWALRGDPPPQIERFLAQVDGIRVIGRDNRRRPQGVWEIFFSHIPGEMSVGIVMAAGKTAKDPTCVCIYAGERSGRIRSMEVVENASGRPPIVIEVS